MHIFPQFTRSTLSGEFTRVGAIIFRGNYKMRQQFCRGNYLWGKISLGVIVRVAIFLEGNYRRGQLSMGKLSGGGNHSEGYYPGKSYKQYLKNI